MPLPQIITIGDSLYWSYANLAMHIVAVEDGVSTASEKHFRIRSRLFSGLRKGTMKVQGFFRDEKLKLDAPRVCWFCADTDRLSADHIIPRDRGGVDSGENLIYACRTCNSSKGAKDLLQWMEWRGEFPSLLLLRRYLKQAIHYCERHNLMETLMEEATNIKNDLPFDLDRIPHNYPEISELRLFVVPLE